MEQEFNNKEDIVSDIKTAACGEKKQQTEQNIAATSPFEADKQIKDRFLLAEIEEIKADLADAISRNDIREIFDYFNIGVFIQRNGLFGLSEYRQPSKNITYSDIGIDEEKLIENVVKISGNADFRHSSLKNFGKILSIGGCADFRHSNFRPDMKLPKIDGKIIFYERQTLLQGLLIKLFSEIRHLFKK